MKNRFYLLMTVLFVLLTFNFSESRVIGPSAGASVSPPYWSVTIPVNNAPSIYRQMAERGDALFQPSTTRGNKKQTGYSNWTSRAFPAWSKHPEKTGWLSQII